MQQDYFDLSTREVDWLESGPPTISMAQSLDAFELARATAGELLGKPGTTRVFRLDPETLVLVEARFDETVLVKVHSAQGSIKGAFSFEMDASGPEQKPSPFGLTWVHYATSYNEGIEALNLSLRTYNRLRGMRVDTIGQLLALSKADLSGFEQSEIDEIDAKLEALGLMRTK